MTDKSWDEMTNEERHQMYREDPSAWRDKKADPAKQEGFRGRMSKKFDEVENEARRKLEDRPASAASGTGAFHPIKKMRRAFASEDAKRAYGQGHTIFVMATSNAIQWLSGVSLSTVAEQIEAVEAAGWRLDHSAYVFDTSGVGNTLRGVHTFRRSESDSPLGEGENDATELGGSSPPPMAYP